MCRIAPLPPLPALPALPALVALLALGAGRAGAQLDPSAGWRTLHTPHFRIHFRPAYRDVALVEAREAERSWGLLATELHPPRGTVDLTLADDGDVANGLTSVYPSSRITIFLAPPAADPGLGLYDSWLRLVTTHELTHVFHLDRTKGVWAVAQHVFGRVPGLFPNEYQPSWVTEGLATYYESKFTNGGRVRGSLHTQVLAADAAAGSSRSPWDALLYSRWADGLVPYAYGSRFFQYLAGSAGDSVVPRFVEATSGQLIPYRVGRQIGRVLPGHSLAGEWPRGTRPAPAAGAGMAVETGVRVVDSLLRTEPVPRVSPDGARVAYVWDDGKGAREVRVLDARTLRLLAAHAVNAEASYDWLGDTLVVAQLDFTSRWRLRSDLYRWVPGGSWRRATRDARAVEPRAGGGRLSIITLGPATNRPALPAPPGPEEATWGAVVPSRDGRLVAASRNAGGHWQLVRWPADAPGEARVLLETRGVIADPTWTAEGELWFVADPSGFPQVYRWRDGIGAEPLTAEPLGARAPAALSDGALLYATLTAGGWELRRAQAVPAGAAPTALPAPLPFAPAPPVPVRETGYTAWPSLRPHFWVPFVLNAGATGRFFGALTAGADALDRYSYAADAFLEPHHPFRAAGDVLLVTDLLGNPTLDLSGSSAWLGVAPPPGAPSLTLSELDQTAALGASFVTRRWRSFASVRFAAEAERIRYATRPDTSLAAVCPGCASRDLVGGSVTLALSRLVAGALSVSPEDGAAWSLTYRRREEPASGRWSTELRSQLALYARAPGVGGFAHDVLAVRLAAGGTGGPLGDLVKVGGVSSGNVGFVFGQSLGAARSFPIRGYASGELYGRRAATATAEYRVPLALVGRSLGHLPVGADKAWLNVFADAGDAWDPGQAPRLTRLRSTGLELASDVAVNYDLLVQLRLGVAEPLAPPPSGAPRRPHVYLALASDF